MREGPIRRLWSRRPRRHVRRVATLEDKLPGAKPGTEDPNPQTPFVLSPRSRSAVKRAKTTFIVDLRNEDLERLNDQDRDEEFIEELDG